jgi:hypothetical protein
MTKRHRIGLNPDKTLTTALGQVPLSRAKNAFNQVAFRVTWNNRDKIQNVSPPFGKP